MTPIDEKTIAELRQLRDEWAAEKNSQHKLFRYMMFREVMMNASNDLLDDVEEMQAEVKKADEAGFQVSAELEWSRAEIERLRALNEGLDALREYSDKVTARIEKLEGAIREASNELVSYRLSTNDRVTAAHTILAKALEK